MMIKVFIIVLLFSTKVFADNFVFNCSNPEGKIKITDQGKYLQIGTDTFRPFFNFQDLDLPARNELNKSNVIISPEGNRFILESFLSANFATIKTLVFAQKMLIRPKAYIELEKEQTVDFICNFSCEIIGNGPNSQKCRK
jgi:hypothetical protein